MHQYYKAILQINRKYKISFKMYIFRMLLNFISPANNILGNTFFDVLYLHVTTCTYIVITVITKPNPNRNSIVSTCR